MRLVSAVLAAASLFVAKARAADQVPAAEYAAKVKRNLDTNIVPFWTSRCLDRQNGGYIINFDETGKSNGKTEKMIVTQARMVWLFSHLAREGRNPAAMLENAALGYRFLRDKMWDKANGGFYWEVDATGTKHLLADKNLYGQSFALYGLSEYAMASKSPDALQLATRLFDVLEAKSHDARYGGYRESFGERWNLLTSGESYMGPVEFKLMNTHLHLLESMTAYYRASHSSKAYTRLMELISIESNAVIRKPLSGCTDKYKCNWQPILDEQYLRRLPASVLIPCSISFAPSSKTLIVTASIVKRAASSSQAASTPPLTKRTKYGG